MFFYECALELINLVLGDRYGYTRALMIRIGFWCTVTGSVRETVQQTLYIYPHIYIYGRLLYIHSMANNSFTDIGPNRTTACNKAYGRLLSGLENLKIGTTS